MNLFKLLIACILFLPQSVKADTDILRVETAFDADLCTNGRASTWAGACICDNPNQFSGRYCSEHPNGSCNLNTPCPTSYYCLIYKNVGQCFRAFVRQTLETASASYALSDSLLSYDNAFSFCASLGNGYRPITRSDFHCTQEGASCLDRQLLLSLQERFGQRGFFWLEEKESSENAYYTDLNDGTIYNTQKDNFKFNQVLCIREKTE